jgi:hypothetical protein
MFQKPPSDHDSDENSDDEVKGGKRQEFENIASHKESS